MFLEVFLHRCAQIFWVDKFSEPELLSELKLVGVGIHPNDSCCAGVLAGQCYRFNYLSFTFDFVDIYQD